MVSLFGYTLVQKQNQRNVSLTKNIVMIKFSLKTGLWKVASTCKIVFRCDFYFWWVVHLIIKILTSTLLLNVQAQWLSLGSLHHSTYHSFYGSSWIWLLMLLHLCPFFDAFHYSSALNGCFIQVTLQFVLYNSVTLPIHTRTGLILPTILSILV